VSSLLVSHRAGLILSILPYSLSPLRHLYSLWRGRIRRSTFLAVLFVLLLSFPPFLSLLVAWAFLFFFLDRAVFVVRGLTLLTAVDLPVFSPPCLGFFSFSFPFRSKLVSYPSSAAWISLLDQYPPTTEETPRTVLLPPPLFRFHVEEDDCLLCTPAAFAGLRISLFLLLVREMLVLFRSMRTRRISSSSPVLLAPPLGRSPVSRF